MSDEKSQKLSEEEHDCDEGQTENLEAGNQTSDSSGMIPLPINISEGTDYNRQLYEAEDTEIMPSDVITVEELSTETITRENSNENSGCSVFYEFPSDFENVAPLPQVCVGKTDDTCCHKNLPVLNYSEYCSAPTNKNQEDKLIEVFDKKTLKEEAPNVIHIPGISEETERKRKKVPISLTQNKQQKVIENPCKPSIQLPRKIGNIVNLTFPDSDSDEFADTEDNVKDSSSSDNCETISIEDLSSKNQQRMVRKMGPLPERESMKANLSPVSSLKGETTATFKLSNETKKKFESSMETILEVPESESDEQIYQPMQSKTNPLKMKTKVGNRKDKCNVCNVRLGLCAIKCRCGGYYCAKHRYDKEHNCSFDYKSMGAEEIRKNNPRIVAEKIRKL